MGDLTTSDMATQGGLKNEEIGRMVMPVDGLVFVDLYASQIANGTKTLIVKGAPYKISGQRYLFLTRNKALGVIKLSAPTEVGLKEFKDLEGSHGITEKVRKRSWPGRKSFQIYKIVELRLFAEPIPIEPFKMSGVMARGIKLNVKSSFATFELSKAEADDFIELGAILRFLTSKIQSWSRKVLRYVQGPVSAIHEIKDFSDSLRRFAMVFPPGGERPDRMTTLPDALDLAARIATKLRRADTGNKEVDKVLIEVPELIDRINEYVDAVSNIEDDGVLRFKEEDIESNNS